MNPCPEERVARQPQQVIPDGRKCINCKAPARNGKITHVPGCPEYVKK